MSRRFWYRSFALSFLTTNLALAQFPQPHAGWKLVSGAENLVGSGYWGALYQWAFASDRSIPAPGVFSISNDVLSVTAGSGYVGGPAPVGPWLYTSGDFGVVATIQTGPGISGTISLTGSLAQGTQGWQGYTAISVGVGAAGEYTLFYSDGTTAGPIFFRTLKNGTGTPPVGQVTMELLRQGGQFLAYFNGVQYGPFPDPGLFKLKYVLPGIQAPPGQQLKVTQFALETPQNDTSAQLIESAGVVPFTHSGDSIGSLAAVTGRTFSVAVDPQQLAFGRYSPYSYVGNTPDRSFAPKVIGEFGAFGNFGMEFPAAEPSQGNFLFDAGDALIAIGKGTGRPSDFCHSALSAQIPYWVTHGNFNKAQLIDIMQTHIQTVMSHYRGECTSWTVLNEAFAANGVLRTDLVWAQVIGPEYVDLAFKAARNADPNAKLFLTEYGAENNNAKATGLYNLVASMKQRGIPIDGVGMQAHWVVGGSADFVPNHDSIVANMAKLAGLGLLVRITELDAQVTLPASAADLATEATFFSTTVQACLDSPNCVGITVFGAEDDISWIPALFPGKGAATMFEAGFKTKPAYSSVMNTLRAAPKAKSTITKVNTSWGGTDIAQNTFIEVKGTNLVPGTTPAGGTIWSTAPDFASGRMPVNLNGVSVTVNGKPAFVYFYCSVVTSPVCTTDQIDVLTPLDNTVGPVQVVVTSGATVSTSFTVTMKAVVPTFLLFNALGPVIATHSDYSLLGGANLYPGATTPAKRGEAIIIYAVGFGLPVVALTNGSSSQSGSLPFVPVCQVGGLPATVIANLISPGLYQLNLTIPLNAKSGDNPIGCTYNGASTPVGDIITVQQ